MSHTRFAFVSRVADDAWLHSLAGTGWEHTYTQLRPGAFNGVMREALLGPVQLVEETVDCPYAWQGRAWPGGRVFLSYRPRDAAPYYDCRPITERTIVTHRWDSVDRVLAKRPTHATFVVVDEAFLGQCAQDSEDHSLASLGGSPVTLTSDPRVVARFESCITGLLAEVETMPTVLDDPVMRSSLLGQVVELLMDVIITPLDRAPQLPRPSTRSYVVERAIAFMERGISDPMTTKDICRAVKVSARTLRYSFESVTGVSPIHYLLAMRLSHARRELMSTRSSAPVQTVAARWGFSHIGHFARYYRRAFGESPSVTARHACSSRRRSCYAGTRP